MKMTAGINQRAYISENVILDFSGIFDRLDEARNDFNGLGNTQPAPDLIDAYRGITEPTERAIAKEPIKTIPRAETEQKTAFNVYMQYQENIKTSSQLQTDILKGLKAGENVYSLLLKASKAIELMTGNKLFYSQIERDIIDIYGAGLLEKPPLKLELEAVQGRLQKLRQAQERDGDTGNIATAIKAHEDRAGQIQELLGG